MNDEEFIKLAYEKGRIEALSKAFEEYPPENEWHKGKVENILNEECEKYSIYSVGDIVFVKNYKYNTGEKGTNHLFVIISQKNLAVSIESFGMLISSQIDKVKYSSNVLLKKDRQNGLNKDSIIKTDKIYKIEDEEILFKIGKVDLDKVEEYKKAYCQIVD